MQKHVCKVEEEDIKAGGCMQFTGALHVCEKEDQQSTMINKQWRSICGNTLGRKNNNLTEPTGNRLGLEDEQ